MVYEEYLERLKAEAATICEQLQTCTNIEKKLSLQRRYNQIGFEIQEIIRKQKNQPLIEAQAQKHKREFRTSMILGSIIVMGCLMGLFIFVYLVIPAIYGPLVYLSKDDSYYYLDLCERARSLYLNENSVRYREKVAIEKGFKLIPQELKNTNAVEERAEKNRRAKAYFNDLAAKEKARKEEIERNMTPEEKAKKEEEEIKLKSFFKSTYELDEELRKLHQDIEEYHRKRLENADEKELLRELINIEKNKQKK